MRFIGSENETPNCAATRSGASSFLFTVAKHPPGYLLSLSCLSSHLPMRWQTTPAATDTRNVAIISIGSPPSCRQDSVRAMGTLYHTVRHCSTLFSAGGLHALSTLRRCPAPQGGSPPIGVPDPCCRKLIFLSELISHYVTNAFTLCH